MEFLHTTVLLKETVDLVNVRPDGVYADLTTGGGGHSLEIAKRLETARKEVSMLPKYDYSVVNETGKIEECAEAIYSIIVAEHHRTTRTKSIMEKFI